MYKCNCDPSNNTGNVSVRLFLNIIKTSDYALGKEDTDRT